MATIALKENTYELLRQVKEESKSETFDDLIRALVLARKKSQHSMFGVLKGVKGEFQREELDRIN